MRRSFPLSAAAILVAAMMLAALPGHAASRDRGVELFMQNRIEEAVPVLERAVGDRPDADRFAWLAEAYRRLDRRNAADSTARLALAARSCHAFAHQVLSDNFLPQYGDWPRADADSAWSHSMSAVACDSGDGNAWLSVWVQAMARGGRMGEDMALKGLYVSEFFPPAVLSYNRWMLRDLPENAILIVNGDVDTYPAHLLQSWERMRRDVAIVNLSLLETDWYRRRVRDQYRVPMPFPTAQLDSLQPVSNADGHWTYAAGRVIQGWLGMVEEGSLGRPLAISTTVPLEDVGLDDAQRVVLRGAFWHVRATPSATGIDTTAVRSSLAGLRGADFVGPWVSRQDRSPIRNRATPGLIGNVLFAAARHYEATVAAGRTKDADATRKWAERFASDAKVSREMAREMKLRFDAVPRP